MRPLLLLLLAAALPACLARSPLERHFRNSRRVLADPSAAADTEEWQISETVSEMLVGCWQAVDGTTNFWSPDLSNMLAWQAAKAGKPMTGAQIFAAGSNLGTLASLPSAPKQPETSKFAVPSICIYGVNRTVGFWAGMVLVRDPSDNIQSVQQMLGWVSKDANTDAELQGNDNTPFLALNAWLNLDTLSVTVQNMKGNEVAGTDFDFSYLVTSEYQKTQEDIDKVLDEAGKWATEKWGTQIDDMTDAMDEAEAGVADAVGDAVDQAQADVADAMDQAEADVADAVDDMEDQVMGGADNTDKP